MLRRSSWALTSFALVACTSATADREPTPPLDHVALALTDTDPVSAAVDGSCSTTSVKGLATQLVAEIQCMRPGSMKTLDGAAGLSLGAAVFPYLQTPAVEALLVAQKARGTTMSINSALRTLPQQYLLYRWYKGGRCGISLAAIPGTSNHEGALAVDLDDAQAWRPAMTDAGFRWLGSSDPVHFDYVGAGTIDFGGLSVTAFQRLWNRNHPEDPIAEDGDYGPTTEDRLARAPVGGFPRGAEGCALDASAPVPPTGPATPAMPAPAADPAAPAPSDDGGCSVAPARSGSSRSGDVSSIALLTMLAQVIRRRLARCRRAAPGRASGGR